MDFDRAMSKVSRSAKRAMLAITAYMGLSIKAFSSFEEQMAQVSTMLNEQTMRYMPAYSKAIKGMAIEFGEGTKTLSEGLYNILSASISADKAIEVLDVAVRSAKAGITDTGTATYAITGILNAYGLAADKASRVSDILFSTVYKGQTTFAQLAPAIGRVTAISSGAGVALEEVSAALATITRGGISTDEAITGLRQGIIALQGKQEQAVELAAKHGIVLSTEALAAKGLSGVLKELSVLSVSTINDMFTEVEARTSISKLIQDQKGYLDDYEQAMRSAGMTQEAFGKNTNILAQRFRRLWQLVKIVSVEVGEEFAGQMTELTELILKHKEKIIEYAEKAADKLSGFIEFMRNDWKAGIKLGLDVSLELFRGFGKSLMVVLEDIFLPLGSNISIWVKRGIAQGLEHRRLINEFLAQMEYSGGITKEAEAAIRQRASQKASEKLSTGYFQPVLEEAYPLIEYKPDTSRLKQITQQTKDEIDRIFQESGSRDYTNLSPFQQFAMDADNWLEKLPGITRETLRYSEALKAVGNITKEDIQINDEATKAANDLAYQRTRITADMYRDMGEFGDDYYNAQKALIDLQYDEYSKFIDDKALLNSWYYDQLEKLSEDSYQNEKNSLDDYFDDLEKRVGDMPKKWADAAASIEYSMANSFDSMISEGASFKDAMTGFAQDIGRAFSRMASQMLAESIMYGTLSGLGFYGPGGGSMITAGGSAAGGGNPYFLHGGGIAGIDGVRKPVPFGTFANAPRFHLGSDEVPAILQRGERVIPKGAGGTQKTDRPIEVHVRSIIVDDRRQAIIEEMKSKEGEKVFIQHAIRNRNLLR